MQENSRNNKETSPHVSDACLLSRVLRSRILKKYFFFIIQTLHHRVALFCAFFLYRFSPLYSFNLHGSHIFRVLFIFPFTFHYFSLLFHSSFWNSFFQIFFFSFTNTFFVRFLLRFPFFSSIMHASFLYFSIPVSLLSFRHSIFFLSPPNNWCRIIYFWLFSTAFCNMFFWFSTRHAASNAYSFQTSKLYSE